VRISADDIENDLPKVAARMRDFAHEEGHHLVIALGQSPEQNYPNDLVHRYKVPSAESIIVLTYAVDLVREGPNLRRLRHLQVQMSVPGVVKQGELNEPNVVKMLLELYQPIVKLFFPLHDHIKHKLSASVPVPIVNGLDSRDPVHHRTPVSAHFVVDMDDLGSVAGAGVDVDEPTGLVQDRRRR
jgi:hypothetical protein